MDHTRNLVYCAPTSGGKSLVADLLVAKRLLRSVNDHAPIALMVLPFVSLCKERLTELTEMYEKVGVQVRGFFGGRRGILPPRFGWGGLIIATPERANDIVTKLIVDDRVGELVTVVVDELHLVQHETRGSILERMLTKLMYATRDVKIAPTPQVIAMSATLPRPFGLGGSGTPSCTRRGSVLSISVSKSCLTRPFTLYSTTTRSVTLHPIPWTRSGRNPCRRILTPSRGSRSRLSQTRTVGVS